MLFDDKKVAVVFDWDKTLSPHYMQQPLFQHFGIDETEFWNTCQARATRQSELLGTRCFVEHEYLNVMLDLAENGTFSSLNNELLSKLGEGIKINPGVEELFRALYLADVEIYIVSSGIKCMIDSIDFVEKYVTDIQASAFSDTYFSFPDNVPQPMEIIRQVAKSVIPSDKIRILNEISKGSLQGKFDGGIPIKEDERRIPFKNMIYVGDGISDIYAFDTVKTGGGYTVGVYNPTSLGGFSQIEMMRQDGYLDVVGVFDFTPQASIGSWILNKAELLMRAMKQERETAEERRLSDRRDHAPKFTPVAPKK